MASFVLRRFISMVITLWLIVTVTFFLMHTIPGSPFQRDGRESNETVIQNLMAHYHLDQPLSVQYILYLKSLVGLDLGPSISHYPDTVNNMIARGFPVSFQLGMAALLFAIVSGIALGTVAALRHNKIIDYAAMVFAVIGIAVPNFIVATVLIKYVAVEWKLFPVASWGTWKHIVLPALALATGPLALIARMTRANMIEVLNQDYIETAKAKGLSPAVIVCKHALRNAVLPVVTLLGALLANVLTGSFVIEKIFAVPGMGKYFVDGINNRDYAVIMGTTVFYSALLVFLMFLVDVAYGIIDPRIKLHKREG
ncbi:ABC transporter permease [Aneurinibacillus aneurinilyticus]|nr:ABC transporter permease [Aneurinibacillus aneurinilyticus]MCI1693196.1 ABC transporter permease [Aneurinibacillus aneurinilyticus]MED0671213.1 ABC transporter permease [Aneurinibacillus aneurinilyticus]MED0704982.1 ABC transporter permease [Aneurinibacillus aneurinilyticus]MED0721783.1 ABC transporter permease [Aneurinibacillus aneurinilyticus]MED0732759.1 ABC transporter permease [Aneurinibacillus aneurinilyticus]